MHRLAIIVICLSLSPVLKATEKAPPKATVPSAAKAPDAATVSRQNGRALTKLRENLKPVPTGDAWLDSLLNEWSDFALDSADEILKHFGAGQSTTESKP